MPSRLRTHHYFASFFISSHIALAQKELCIQLINSNTNVVEFAGIADPGWTYKVPPNQSAILSRDHMAGACFGKNDCTIWVSILDGRGSPREDIYHLPRGASINYKGLRNYTINRTANVQCVN